MLIITLFNYCFLSWNKEQLRKKKLQKKNQTPSWNSIITEDFLNKIKAVYLLPVYSTVNLSVRASKILNPIHCTTQDVRICWKAALLYT